MKKYLVLQHFTWGKLQLEKGQQVVTHDINDHDSFIFETNHKDKRQRVTTQAIASMESLEKIKAA